VHAEISGTVDFKEPNDQLCLARLRSLVGRLGHGARAPFDRGEYDEVRDAPKFPASDLYGLLDPDLAKTATHGYDMHEILTRLLDRSEFEEYKAGYGKTVICGYGRIGGFAVGIVANQKTNQKHIAETGEKRLEFGGVIYAESAEKAARFVMDCNQSLIPLIFLHDVNGFMVGRDAEWSGIIRAGAKMVAAVANSVVPKITVILGGSFGAGHYAMCGKAYDPRFLFAWPTARYAVMSGASAAATLVELKVKQLERAGKEVGEEEKGRLLDGIKKTYDEQSDCRYAAARLWVDAIIDPARTREALLLALEAASLNPEVAKFNPGVLQT
jgi:3-methylcrotonyl-CoA carboxylase beta subunit